MSKKNVFILAFSLILVIGAVITIYLIENNKQANKNNEEKAFGFEAIRINGEYISTEVFRDQNNAFFEKYKRNAEMLYKTEEERNDLLLDFIIENVVVDDYCENKSGIVVSDEEVEEYIETRIKKRYSDPAQLSAFMASSNYKTEEDMKEGIREYILKHRCYLEAAKKYGINPDEKKVDEDYRNHKLLNRNVNFRHILISNSTRTDEEALALANEIYSKLKDGESFEEMAKQYSEDEITKEAGGLIENAVYNTSEDAFYETVFNSEPGELIGPFKVSKGYEIALVEKNVGFYRTREEYKEIIIVNEFLNSKEEYNKWLEEIKKEYDIEITDPLFKAYRLFKDGKYAEAAKEYENAYVKKDDLGSLAKAAEAYILSEDWENVIRVSSIGIKKDPKIINHYLYNAEGLYRTDQKDKCLKMMKKAEAIAKDNTYLLSLVLNTYNKLGLSDDADRISNKINGK